VGSIHDINLAFARSSLCLVRFSSTGRDGPSQAVDGEVGSPFIEDSCTPVDTRLSDMTLPVINSKRNSVTDSSIVVSSSNIRARD
jgi:hypothetical protein